MPLREPVVAGLFYPADADACRQELERYVRAAELIATASAPRAGIVPHAGWVYSGQTAAHTYVALTQRKDVETVVLFGAVHSWGVPQPSLFGAGAWRSPLGDAPIDEEVARAVLGAAPALVVDQPAAHADEHAIEVQVPFVQYLFPQARILPIAVPPLDAARAVGELVARTVTQLGRRAVAVGSSDLTHYGPRYGMAPAGIGEGGLMWARENDTRLLRRIEALQAEAVLEEAATHHNACGAGAIAAAIGFAAALGATRGTLIHYTTSYHAAPRGRPVDFVGYGAMALA